MSIPVDKFGKDHNSTLLYVESRCVDHAGKLDRRHMRDSPDYPTRLNDGTKVDNHTDYDCLDDFEAADLIAYSNGSTGLNPMIELTDAGWTLAHHLRRERAERLIK